MYFTLHISFLNLIGMLFIILINIVISMCYIFVIEFMIALMVCKKYSFSKYEGKDTYSAV